MMEMVEAAELANYRWWDEPERVPWGRFDHTKDTAVMTFLTLQRCKVTVLHLLDRELYCLKLTSDYVTTLTNYKGWIAFTTQVS